MFLSDACFEMNSSIHCGLNRHEINPLSESRCLLIASRSGAQLLSVPFVRGLFGFQPSPALLSFLSAVTSLMQCWVWAFCLSTDCSAALLLSCRCRLQLWAGNTSVHRVPCVVCRMREADVESELVHTLALSTAWPSKHLSVSPSFQHFTFASWIRKNIRKRECFFYETGVR